MESTVFLLTNPDGTAIPRQDIPSALKALTHMTLVSLVWCPNNCLVRVSKVIPKSKARVPRTGKQDWLVPWVPAAGPAHRVWGTMPEPGRHPAPDAAECELRATAPYTWWGIKREWNNWSCQVVLGKTEFSVNPKWCNSGSCLCTLFQPLCFHERTLVEKCTWSTFSMLECCIVYSH